MHSQLLSADCLSKKFQRNPLEAGPGAIWLIQEGNGEEPQEGFLK